MSTFSPGWPWMVIGVVVVHEVKHIAPRTTKKIIVSVFFIVIQLLIVHRQCATFDNQIVILIVLSINDPPGFVKTIWFFCHYFSKCGIKTPMISHRDSKVGVDVVPLFILFKSFLVFLKAPEDALASLLLLY